MRSFFCFLFVLFPLGLWAQTATPTSSSLSALDRVNWERFHPAISEKYLRGNYLIYDCVDGHFACVEERNFNDCRKIREDKIILGLEVLPCAPFKEYATYSLCVKKQYELVHSAKAYSFCFKANFN